MPNTSGVIRCVFFCLALQSAGWSHGDDRPSFLLALADNWGWPHAGILGDPTAKTPFFDQFAREGVLCTHVFCPVPSCSPTRSCLLTGRAAHQLGEAASLWSGFPTRMHVLTADLRAAGYEVGFSGKGWGPGNFLDSGWKENPIGPQYRSFAEFLEQRDSAKPFFFWLGNTDTSLNKWRHDPEGWAGLDPDTIVVPPSLPDVPAVRESLLGYYGAVGRVDADFGQADRMLRDQKLADNTVVIWTSDNGWQMPRGLANCYDSGIRVPMAIRWGTRLTPGLHLDQFISLTDLAPTILELAQLSVPAEMTGRSFADLLQGRSSTVPRDHVFVERERHANVREGNLSYPIRGIRTREYLYLWNLRPERWPAGDPRIWFAVGDYGDVDNSRAKAFLLDHASRKDIRPFFELCFSKRPEEELYDIRQDPYQMKNVATDPALSDVRRRLRQSVEQWMQETGDPRVDPRYDAWDTFPYYGPRPKPAVVR